MLSEAFLRRIVTELDGKDVTAIGLTGSYARGGENPFSDVDVYCFRTQPPRDAYDRYQLRMIEGYLTSITKTTLEAKRADLNEPDAAVWAVPGLRQMQILLDKQGELAALKREAEAFQWEGLQAAADQYASAELMGLAEEAHKVMGGLLKGDDSALVYATYGLVLGLARAVLVARGVLLESENGFFEQAQQVFGSESPWPMYFRCAAGLDEGQPASGRACAVLHLYREAVRSFRAIIRPEHSEVIEKTVELIDSMVLEFDGALRA
jgi:predicted nucleotidyltransferase